MWQVSDEEVEWEEKVGTEGHVFYISGHLRAEGNLSGAENTKNINSDKDSSDDEDTEKEEEEVWKLATNTEEREEEAEVKSPATSEVTEVNKVQLSNEIVVEKHLKAGKETECMDKFKNCQVVVQSRLCRYSFYQSNCCQSCSYLRL